MSRLAAAIVSGAIASLGLLSTAAGLHAQQKPAETDKPCAISTISVHLLPYIDTRDIAGCGRLRGYGATDRVGCFGSRLGRHPWRPLR
jgi:hypothetical protein